MAVDSIKCTSIIKDYPNWYSQNTIELFSTVNMGTAELKPTYTPVRKYDDGSLTYKQWGQIEHNYFIEVIEKQNDGKSSHRLNVRGSIHKAALGQNYDRLTWSQLRDQVDVLAGKLNIQASDLQIQNIEFGVNIDMSKAINSILNPDDTVYNYLTQSLISFMGEPFNKYYDRKKNLSIGFYQERTQYTVKIYDKTLQNDLKDGSHLLRLEKSVHKMQCLQKHGIKTLEDLKDEGKVYSLELSLTDMWDRIIIIDPALYDKVDQKNKSNADKYGNNRFWAALKCNPDKYKYHRERLKEIQVKNGDSIHADIKSLIKNEWENCFESPKKYPPKLPIVIADIASSKPTEITLKMNGNSSSITSKYKKPRVKKSGLKVAGVLNGNYFNLYRSSTYKSTSSKKLFAPSPRGEIRYLLNQFS